MFSKHICSGVAVEFSRLKRYKDYMNSLNLRRNFILALFASIKNNFRPRMLFIVTWKLSMANPKVKFRTKLLFLHTQSIHLREHDSTNQIRTMIDDINLDDKHKSKMGVNLKTTFITNMLINRIHLIRLRLMIVST